jgi:nuclear pore complex protein Nup205
VLIHVQGALRNSITAFVKVSPQLKDAVWSYLEQYDLPVVTVSPGQHTATQVPPEFTWKILT